jgi:hypothetical protein
MEASTLNVTSGVVRRLTCACCGEDAGRWHQHWNRDTGFGICVRCAKWIQTRETRNPDNIPTPEEFARTYGVEGVNWGQPPG